MEVRKESNGLKNSMVTREELAIINRFTKRALKEDEVYTFAVRLCDGERFPRATLEELAELFVGKSGIFDHEWTARGQAARIYRTEIVEEAGVCSQGEGRCYLKGYAYMLRGGANDALIEEIEGGIKREVSVGCSVERRVCSICGGDIGTCAHRKGEKYGGKVCCAELTNAQDAYEWSFVAVPAQPRAGVLKRCGGEENGTLKALVKRRGSRANQKELETLEQQAALGKRYLSELRGEVKRLVLVCEQEADGAAIEKLAAKLDEEELREMERLYRVKAAKKLGLKEVPAIVADDLTDEQVKAFRLADNKVAEQTEWDYALLADELDEILGIDMEDFGFSFSEEDVEVVEDAPVIEPKKDPVTKLGDMWKMGGASSTVRR